MEGRNTSKPGTASIITQVTKDDTSLIKTGNESDHKEQPVSVNTIQVQTVAKEEKKSLASVFCKFFCFCTPNKTLAYQREIDQTTEIQEGFLLPPFTSQLSGKKCLVLDLDETLVHSSFKPIPNPDFIIPVEIEDQIHKVYVIKRPGVDKFLEQIGPHFEVVVFTASLSKYADPVLDLLDKGKVVHYRLFREACVNYKGNYVKDLNRLGRDIKETLIVDNSPSSYLFHPENAIPIETWFDDESDTELQELFLILEKIMPVDNVRIALENAKKKGGKLTSASFT